MIWAHLTILALTAIIIVATDIYGLRWILGQKQTLDMRVLNRTHALIWIGLIGMIASGLYMMIPSWEGYLSLDLFKGKMFFVLVLVINAWFIGRHMELAAIHAWKELPRATQRSLILGGAVSSTCWIATFLLAKIMFGW